MINIELNKIYCLDNVLLMPQIQSNSVDLIYSDILYNTGRKFKDFNDDLGSTEDAIKWYIPRLEEMYRLLKSTGSLFLQMDQRLSHYMKVELDKIFGEINFKNHITWERQKSSGAKAKSKQFSRNSDHILFYTKTNDYTWNGCFVDYDDKYIKERFRPDENGRLFMDCRLGDYSDESILRFEKENKIYITKNGKKRLKRYLDECNGKAVGDIWSDINDVNSMSKEKLDYDTQKPKELLRRIISATTNKGDVVADFFCGSGTTIEVANELGRNYIGCDINSKSIEITNKRIM